MDSGAFLANLDAMFADGRAADVGAYLRDGLRRAEDEGDDAAALTILNEMIGYFRSISSHVEAIDASMRALARTGVPALKESVARGTTLLNAATAYKAAGQPESALPLYLEAVSVYAEALPPGDERMAGLHNNISSLYESLGRHEEALQALGKAAEVLDLAGNTGVEAATVATNTALVLFKLGREAEARKMLDRALAMFEAMRGKDGARPSHYASALAALGEAYYTTGRHAEAAEVFERALSELRFHYGENQDYALTCRNYAVVLDALGRKGEAEELRRTADRVREELRRRNTPPQA